MAGQVEQKMHDVVFDLHLRNEERGQWQAMPPDE
jgi:hypothetical protein